MIKPLTSLRFFFAFCVFLCHLYFLRESKFFHSIFTNVLSEGFLGVGFFFILSGFILALNYKDKFRKKTISLKKFYISRFARIYPMHFITLLAAIPISVLKLKIILANLFLCTIMPIKIVF